MYRIDGTSIFHDFGGGINVASSPYHLAENEYRDGNNIYISEGNEIGKRRGRTLHNATALGSDVHSLHRIYIGASTGFVAGASTVLYEDDALAGVFASIKAGLTGNTVRGFVFPGDDWFYFCDGTNMFKYNLTNVRNWGINAPAAAPTATPNGAGGAFPITNGYIYAYTYYNGATGRESEYKAGTTTGADLNADKVVVGVTASTDAQVTNIKIYRTKDGGGVFYYQSTVANTTGNHDDTTIDDNLGDAYACAGHDEPAAAKDCIVIHNRVILVGASMAVQVSQLGEPEYFPDTGGYRFTLDIGMGVDIVRAWPYQAGTQNAPLFFKDRSIVVAYGMDYEDPTNWDFRVVDPETGLHAANSIAGGYGRIFWLAQSDGRFKAFTFSKSEGIYSISKNIEPLLNKSTSALLAGAVGWFYDGKYFLSYPSTADSTGNDRIEFYDVRNGGWHPYSKDFGVTAACVFSGSGDSGQMYVGDSSGYVDYADAAGAYGDRSGGYSNALRTRYDAGGSIARKKKYWIITAENYGSNYDVSVITDKGFTSVHVNDQDTTDIWLGGWIGGWSYSGNKILDGEMTDQGIVGRYVSVEFASESNTDEASIVMAAVDYSLEDVT